MTDRRERECGRRFPHLHANGGHGDNRVACPLAKIEARWCPCGKNGSGAWGYFIGEEPVDPPKDVRRRRLLIRQAEARMRRVWIRGFVLAPVLGWVVVAWFAGMIVADGAHSPKMKRVGHTAVLCRPWCYMSGSFYDGVIRPAAPWPFRRGQFFECPKEGDRDYCTGDKFHDGRWEPCGDLIEGKWFPGRVKAGEPAHG